MGLLVTPKKGMNNIDLGKELYRVALSKGMSLTMMLEDEDPSEQYRNDPMFAGTDAYERQLWRCGIRTQSDPVRGIWASTVEDFWNANSRVPGAESLFPEWMRRKYQQVAMARSAPGDYEKRFYMSSSPVSDVINPAFISGLIRQKQIAPPIPLSVMIALTTPVDTNVYKAFYLTDDEEGRVMHRVAEGDPLPTATLTGADHTINLYKYGRRLKATYESVRRMNLDRFALHIALIGVQAEIDKVNQCIDVLINGDGNAGTAATSYNLTTLDTGAVAGTPTVKSYLAWRMKWTAPYNCNVVLAREDETLKFLLMDTGSANVTFWQMFNTYGIGSPFFQNNPFSPPFTGWTDGVTANLWLGFDNNWAVEQVIEIGSDLIETDRLIDRQFDVITISEVVGFGVFDAEAARVMVINA